MIHRKYLLLFILFVILSRAAHSQDSANTIGRVTISSPNAASLGKYGDVPVSYHTGIPDISIPIYTVKSGGLSLPISLSYHASGLKVQEQASWVGAGWSLNAGGMITRTVRGAADDRGYNNGYVTNGYYSDSGYYNYSFHPGAGMSTPHTNGTEPDDQQFIANRKDGEPDMFTFNFAGHSGKFYFNDDQTPMIVPEEDLKIETDLFLGPGFRGFTITTSDGTKYYFGKTGNNGSVDPVENTYFITTQNTYGLSGRVASSWFLNKVISADGMDSILLNYQQENYSYYGLSMFPVYYQSSQQFIGTWASYPYEYDVAKNFISGVRLTSITFPNGTLTFTPSGSARTDLSGYTDQTMNDQANTDAKALASIQISDNGTFCKTFTFSYGYFYDNVNGLNGGLFQAYPTLLNVSSDKYRLRLDSIQESSCDATLKIPSYKFSYFSELVPRKMSFGLDHWGFYNGVYNNSTLLPTSTMRTESSYTTWSGANRDAGWPSMRGGTLQQITYPTGGYTKFDFEPNYTNATSTQLTPIQSFYMSNGFDGNQTNPKYSTFTTPSSGSGFYQLYLQSYQTAGTGGSLELRDQNNVTVAFVNVNSGGTASSYATLPSNTTYTVVFWNNYIQSGQGINGIINEINSTTTSANTMVGGLRVKSIVNNDNLTAINDTTYYSYNVSNDPNANSSGILYSRPIYIQVIRNDVANMVFGNLLPGGCGNPGNSIKGFYRSPSSLRAMETTMGNHIGYNQVYVRKPNNGYSVYMYYGSNVWDMSNMNLATTALVNTTYCDPNTPNYPAAPEQFDAMRGQLKYEAHYNQNNQLLKDVWYLPVYTQNPISTPGHIAFQNPLMSSYTDYALNTYRKVKDTKITTAYVPGMGYVTDSNTVYYGSSYHHQPTRAVQLTSLNDSIITNFRYAFDFRANCDTISDSLTYYNNSVGSANATFATTVSCSPQSDLSFLNNCRYQALVNLRFDLAAARIKYMNYLKRSYSNTNSVYNTCHLNAKNSAGTELKPILELQDFFENPVIEQTQWRNSNLLHANFTRYDYATNPSGKVYPQRTQLVNLASPSASFTNAVVSGSTISKDSRYKDESSYLFAAGNPVQVTPHEGVISCYIWDYLNTQPIAKVIGTTSDQIAYTSFEADGKGGWTFSGTPTTDNTAPTGRKDYTLNGSNNITRSGLTSSTTYILSYWTKNSSAYSIAGTISGYPISGRTVSGWQYFEHKITGQSAVTITGTGTIDELRLYPATAQMTTYSYDPLRGMTSQCDMNNRIAYYEYDNLQRLVLVRDQDRNIVKRICYNYAGQVENCSAYLNVQKSGNFTRNNCPTGATGGTVTYTVPANTYSSFISQADADAQAQSDVDQNGQNYANNNATCSWWNSQQSGNFTPNNCASGYTGNPVAYTVAANTYSSTTSQAAADQLAINDVNANGQNYANTHGSCTATCSFSMFSCWSKATSGITSNMTAGSSAHNVSYYVTFYWSCSGNANWGQTNTIATISSTCVPPGPSPANDKQQTFTAAGCTWSVTVQAGTGLVKVTKLTGTAPTGATPISLTNGSYSW